MRPTGTVTLLISDIEGSTRLLRAIGVERYEKALQHHNVLLRDAFARHAGYECDTAGDSFFVAFGRALDAVHAARDAQCALASYQWPDGERIRVRIGIHTCEATATPSGYVGMGVHRAARVSSAGHGDQILPSQTTRDLLGTNPMSRASISALIRSRISSSRSGSTNSLICICPERFRRCERWCAVLPTLRFHPPRSSDVKTISEP